MGVESDREIAAADTQPHDQGAVRVDMKAPATVFARQRPAGAQNRRASGKADLAAVSVSGKSNGEALLLE